MRIGGENGVRQIPAVQDAGAQPEPNGARTGQGTRETPREGPSPFALVLGRLGRDVDQGEKVMRRAVDGGGKDLGPAELLALQAGVYRYSEAVDLSAKLVDRATSGVKTVLQGQ
jgi:hypothetical protein